MLNPADMKKLNDMADKCLMEVYRTISAVPKNPDASFEMNILGDRQIRALEFVKAVYMRNIVEKMGK